MSVLLKSNMGVDLIAGTDNLRTGRLVKRVARNRYQLAEATRGGARTGTDLVDVLMVMARTPGCEDDRTAFVKPAVGDLVNAGVKVYLQTPVVELNAKADTTNEVGRLK